MGRVVRRLKIDRGPRRSPSACAEVFQKKSAEGTRVADTGVAFAPAQRVGAGPFSTTFRRMPTATAKGWIESEGGVGTVSVRRVVRRLKIDRGPRRSPSACAEILRNRRRSDAGAAFALAQGAAAELSLAQGTGAGRQSAFFSMSRRMPTANAEGPVDF